MEKINITNGLKKIKFLRITGSKTLIHPVSFNHNLKIIFQKNKLVMRIVTQIKKIVLKNFNPSNNHSKT